MKLPAGCTCPAGLEYGSEILSTVGSSGPLPGLIGIWTEVASLTEFIGAGNDDHVAQWLLIENTELAHIEVDGCHGRIVCGEILESLEVAVSEFALEPGVPDEVRAEAFLRIEAGERDE
ncbi:hypothetical protein L0U85_03605 [Glycomyces sp. L485]|uniref:hypothetical protein n=1 Tax=Glycomyces sp. L485 TaxID=2909235 RepID=UPI001F4B6FEE|nr:hypothetical protein [Glycomyces sp. L485]MCH7229948.1 hypothetical protein [Glycomyces sp. L485]